MPIGDVYQQGCMVFVKDEAGREILSRPIPSDGQNGLKGFTSTTYTVLDNGILFVYDEYGNVVSQRHV